MARSNAARELKQGQIEQKNQLRVVYGTKTPSRRFYVSFVSSLFCLLGLAVFSLFCRAKLTEVTEQINQDTKKLEALESEELRLRSRLEDSACAQNVEGRARCLGMEKVHDYQVEYINVSRDDNVEVN